MGPHKEIINFIMAPSMDRSMVLGLTKEVESCDRLYKENPENPVKAYGVGGEGRSSRNSVTLLCATK